MNFGVWLLPFVIALVQKTKLKFINPITDKSRASDESMVELAQSLKKMTRKAYPKVSTEVINILALDPVIDAIRIRLREVGAKDINEAEQVAVRHETCRLADRQRGKHFDMVENQPNNLEAKVQELGKIIKCIAHDLKEMKEQESRSPVRLLFKTRTGGMLIMLTIGSEERIISTLLRIKMGVIVLQTGITG